MRKGFVSAGNWLVDFVKMIEKYPSAGNLVSIDSIEVGLGGCSHNVLVDLARMETRLPLYAGGCVGDDDNGKYVLREIEKHHIDGRHMTVIPVEYTSYTDVMSDKTACTRTFFHYRGANAHLDVCHLEKMDTDARIFHLGYLLLLDKLDAADEEYGVRAARALDMLQQMGYKTSVDVVSEESDRFAKIILPCLPYTDYLIINEIEAAKCSGQPIRMADGSFDMENLKSTAAYILNKGVGQQVTIHFPEGGFTIRKDGTQAFVPSFKTPAEDIVSTVGAGDAFCAGMLYAIHEEYPIEEALRFANACAKFNLGSATSTGGAPTLEKILNFLKQTK